MVFNFLFFECRFSTALVWSSMRSLRRLRTLTRSSNFIRTTQTQSLTDVSSTKRLAIACVCMRERERERERERVIFSFSPGSCCERGHTECATSVSPVQ